MCRMMGLLLCRDGLGCGIGNRLECGKIGDLRVIFIVSLVW